MAELSIREIIPQQDAKNYSVLQKRRAEEGLGPVSDLTINQTEKWEARLNRKALNLVAEDKDGNLVGSSGAQIHQGGKIANLRGLYVVPENRRLGIGSNLVKEMLALLKSKGVETVITEIDTDNVASLSQHLALGFEIVGSSADRAGKQYNKLQITLI